VNGRRGQCQPDRTAGGSQSSGRSTFIGTADEVEDLVAGASSAAPIVQPGGRLQWIVDAGRGIGVDRATGALTSMYTVITDAAGNLITAFPGLPGQ
jgi:hypothetical protein